MAFILFKPFENQTKYSRGSKTELFKMVASLEHFTYKYKLSLFSIDIYDADHLKSEPFRLVFEWFNHSITKHKNVRVF